MVWPMTTGRGAGWVRGGLCRGCAGASEDCTCVENEPGHRLIMLSGCPCHCVSFLPPSPSPSASSTGVERGSGLRACSSDIVRGDYSRRPWKSGPSRLWTNHRRHRTRHRAGRW